MKKLFKAFALMSIIVCLNACGSDTTKHPTGNPREDASVYRKMLNSGDVQEANQFVDEVFNVYMEKYSKSSHEAYTKIDEFWEWSTKLK